LVRDEDEVKRFMLHSPGVMVSSTIAPTAEGNLAIRTVDELAAWEMVVCAVSTGARSSDPVVGTDVEVDESMNRVRPPAAPFFPAGPVGPLNWVFPDQFGEVGPLICIGSII
jgi:hypothetical protein